MELSFAVGVAGIGYEGVLSPIRPRDVITCHEEPKNNQLEQKRSNNNIVFGYISVRYF